MSTDERLPFDGLVLEVVRDAMAGVREEIKAAVSQSKDAIELRDGHAVGRNAQHQLWSFEVDSDLSPMPETPGLLLVGNADPVRVTVLAVGDSNLVLSSPLELGSRIAVATLSLEPGFVLQKLNDRIDELSLRGEDRSTLVDQFLFPDPGLEVEGGLSADSDSPTAEESQQNAAERAIRPGLRFTWGPPGTGKTRVLALAVAAAARRGDRVLVLSHANAAVDVAAERTAGEMAGDPLLAGGKVLRVGTPSAPDSLPHSVRPDKVVGRLRPELPELQLQLEAERRELSDQLRVSETDVDREKATKRLNAVRAESAANAQDIRTATAAIIEDATVVFATLSKVVVDEQLWNWAADVVIVDEASMASLPFMLALVLRGSETLSLFGDFRQLPPIAVSQTEVAQQWFARDVFEFCGVVERVEQAAPDDRLSVLRTQFRMGEQICEAVNRLSYGGLLRTDTIARNRGIRLAESVPSQGYEILVVDSSDLGGFCTTQPTAGSFSRFSLLSAALSATIARTLASDGCEQVGLISPYWAQTQLLAAATRGVEEILASTIHRFQGSERDAIVVDITDGPPFPGPSRLTGKDAQLATRLLNVAVSRARGKLVLVADRQFIETCHPKNSPARQLLEFSAEIGADEVTAATLLNEEVDEPMLPYVDEAFEWFSGWRECTERILEDVRGAIRVDVNLRNEFHGGAWLGELAHLAGDSKAVTIRAAVSMMDSLESSRARLLLNTVGDAPVVVVDEDTCWIGSVLEGGPAVRVKGQRFVATVGQLLLRSE